MTSRVEPIKMVNLPLNKYIEFEPSIYTLDNGRIKGTKLSLYQKDQYGDDYNVYLTQTSHDTNPCTIDGIKYNMTISEN